MPARIYCSSSKTAILCNLQKLRTACIATTSFEASKHSMAFCWSYCVVKFTAIFGITYTDEMITWIKIHVNGYECPNSQHHFLVWRQPNQKPAAHSGRPTSWQYSNTPAARNTLLLGRSKWCMTNYAMLKYIWQLFWKYKCPAHSTPLKIL